MSGAATVRFPAPVTTFPVLRDHLLARVVAVLHVIALANLVAWFYCAATPAPATIAIALLTWLVAVLVSMSARGRHAIGELAWDTESWHFKHANSRGERDPDYLGKRAHVTVDLQFCMLLHFPETASFSWLLVQRHHALALWLALRRAVYSSATVMQLPSHPIEPGAATPN